MSNPKYRTLVNTPPVITIVENAREVIFTLISAMCDNTSTMVFRKNSDGDFKANILNECFGNIQAKHDKIDMEWAADEYKWKEVIKMINTGTSRVSSVRSR